MEEKKLKKQKREEKQTKKQEGLYSKNQLKVLHKHDPKSMIGTRTCASCRNKKNR